VNTGPLTPERILEAAEETLRRFGPGKTTVVDVARALGVSHGSVYRHFPTKAALRDAVVSEWLERSHGRLAAIAQEDGPAADRLERLIRALKDWKWAQAQDDPDVFSAYAVLTDDAGGAVTAHVDFVVARIAEVVEDGVRRGEFASKDPRRTAQAVMDATGRFHNPAHRDEWRLPTMVAAFDGVWELILNGLVPRKDAG
jgi:AcrR family transcriptional regulator